MLARIYAITRNTLSETVRQPVFGVLLLAAMCLIAVSPAFTMFTLVNHIKMVKDMGLATMMVTGLLLAVAAASTVISEEIRKRTVLTVVSKPVDRFEFILGKYLGIAAALVAAGLLLTIVLTMTARVGVPVTVNTRIDYAPLLGMLAALFLTMAGAFVGNYFFDRPFPSMAIGLGLIFFCAAFVLTGVLPAVQQELKHGTLHYDWSLFMAGLLILMATWVIAAVAVAASTRLNPLLTLGVCAGFFILGLLSDYVIGGGKGPEWLTLAYHAVFNLQAYWMASALADQRTIPFSYVVRALLYGICYLAAILCAACALFQDREVAR